MKLIIAIVRDRAAEAFARPMFLPSVGTAIRSFTDEVNRNNEENIMHHHPDDFELYDVGVFDDSNCKFELYDQPKLLVTGKQVKTSN